MQGEYRGDFTRDTFQPWEHFSRVLMQQGRVQLDADFNEQTSILLYYLQSLAADLIGPHGGSINGFNAAAIADSTTDFAIGQGRYYVDGILCEISTPAVPATSTANSNTITLQTTGVSFAPNDYIEIIDASSNSSTFAQIQSVSKEILTLNSTQPYTNPSVRHAVTYGTQPYYPVPDAQALENLVKASGQCILYLDVWERHINYLEHPACREVALGGPDTAARAKIVWQLRLATAPTPRSTLVFPTDRRGADDQWWSQWVALFQPPMRGLLKAQVQPQANNNDPCTISPASSYRGPENQLYRVEINTGGAAGAATFKWSRENGSVVFPISQPVASSGQASTLVTLGSLGRDEYLGLSNYDWMEIVDDVSILQNLPGTLLQVSNIDPTSMQVTLTGVPGTTVGTDASKHPLLRRWDQNDSAASDGITLASDGCVKLVEGKWLPLEYGIQILFQCGATYRTGDYWLIPARVATGNIEWPPGPAALPPHGIEHHYAPLAVISIDASDKISPPVSLRRILSPVAK
jgi:Family of unknown function (DUF6519)